MLLGGLVDKDVNQTHISCEHAVGQKLVKSEIGDGVPLSRTCTLVCDGPQEIKEVQGIVLTSPGRPSEGMGQIGLSRMTHAKTLDNCLPIQGQPRLRLDTQSHSQITHVT